MKIAILVLLVLVSFVTVNTLSSDDYKEKYSKITLGQIAPSEKDIEQMFTDFLITFKNTNKTGDLPHRYEVFKNKLKAIMEHNQNPSSTWVKGINAFSDWTDEEFSNFYRLDLTESQNCSATASPKKSYNSDFPAFFDWSEHGKVSPVKNQGGCGSCWAFSTVGAMEAHALLSSNSTPGPKFNFTEQQLVDCAGDFDNHGCSGGLPSHAFEYISYNGGLEHRDTYSYHAVDGTCKHNQSLSVVTTTGAFNITKGDEVELHEAIYHEGPVSVAYQVVGDFRDYQSGVYTSDVCKNSTMDVNHAVLAVGFGHENGTEYFRIKNSWGANWGDHGFFKIEAYKNMCGIAVCNSYPENVNLLSGQSPNSVKDFLIKA